MARGLPASVVLSWSFVGDRFSPPLAVGHTIEYHESLKLDESAWSELRYVGIQHFPAEDGAPDERLELRNCTCGSTLARRLS